MTSRDLQEVASGLNSHLWRYIKEELTRQAIELRREGSRYSIQSLTDTLVREQLFMRANALEEFVESLPNQIQTEYKKMLAEENKTNE